METQYTECCLCSFVGKLTKEHIPPKSAYNYWKPTYKQYYKVCLCWNCNNFTGIYAQEYCNVAKQAMEYLVKIKDIGGLTQCNLVIKNFRPLRFIKYLALLLLTTNNNNNQLKYNHPNLPNFVLNKESHYLLDKYRIHLNLFDEPLIFKSGLYTKMELYKNIQFVSEFYHIPFHNVISIGQDFEDMIDISFMKKYSYDERVAELNLPVKFSKSTSILKICRELKP